ncbi:MAG: MarR family transcriptional regulator [Anaerolineae bacterium]|nr:MarR family transcriptional regulator [Anaerolineae bacterium]
METTDPLVYILEVALGIFRHRLMGNLFIFTKAKGLSVGQYGALLKILHKGGCGVSDIGNDLGVSNSAASQLLERLVQLKLITRSEDPDDRRFKQIVLTEKGLQILQEGSLANRNWLEDLARSMTIEEQEQVRSAIVILIEKTRQIEIKPN